MDGSGTGSFTSYISGLTPNTTYHLRAYATNSVGTAYSADSVFNTTSFSLPNVTIGTQIWTTQNLSVAKYRNGDPIPQVTDPTAWDNLTTGAWCWYNNDSGTYSSTFGRLYNWYVLNDPRGLAPQGWHVPSDGEWNIMTKYLDPLLDTITGSGANVAGIAMKSTSGWNLGGNGSNASGFTGLPGGCQISGGDFNGTAFGNGLWWSTSEFSVTGGAWYRYLSYYYNDVFRLNCGKTLGLSVRLVRD